MNKKCIISGYSRKRYRKKCIKFCTIFSPPSSPLSLIRLQTTLRLLMTVCLPAVFFPTRSLLLILHTLLTHGSWLIIITIISCCRMLLYKAVPICCLAVNMIYILLRIFLLVQSACSARPIVFQTFVYRVHLLSTIMARATMESEYKSV